jgi:hypothetical protein
MGFCAFVSEPGEAEWRYPMPRGEFLKPDVLNFILLLAMFAVMLFFHMLTGVFAFFSGMH